MTGRPASVLLALQDDRLWLTKRASGLRHHPGQIALPGGKLDPCDADATTCALREAEEEVGLSPASVEVLGVLPLHLSGTGFAITPVVGAITAPFTPFAQAGEVEETFTVPLSHVLDLSRYTRHRRVWRGQTRDYWSVPYGPHYIWGATAGILHSLATRIA